MQGGLMLGRFHTDAAVYKVIMAEKIIEDMVTDQ